MKKTSMIRQQFALMACLLGAGIVPALAQQTPPLPMAPPPPPTEVSVRIIETTDANEIVELNRTYRVDGMTDDRRDAMVNKLVDSLRAKRNGKPSRQLTIIVEDSRDSSRAKRDRRPPRPNRGAEDYALRPGPGWRQLEREMSIGFDSLGRQMKRFNFQMPMDLGQRMARPFEDWAREANGKPASIRGLEAYPNNPDRNQLNIRFMAPATGNVLIVVTNPKGKDVVRRELTNFTGEFVGQVDLGKKASGTFFVTVTQNDDGAVKRVVVD